MRRLAAHAATCALAGLGLAAGAVIVASSLVETIANKLEEGLA